MSVNDHSVYTIMTIINSINNINIQIIIIFKGKERVYFMSYNELFINLQNLQ